PAERLLLPRGRRPPGGDPLRGEQYAVGRALLLRPPGRRGRAAPPRAEELPRLAVPASRPRVPHALLAPGRAPARPHGGLARRGKPLRGRPRPAPRAPRPRQPAPPPAGLSLDDRQDAAGHLLAGAAPAAQAHADLRSPT